MSRQYDNDEYLYMSRAGLTRLGCRWIGDVDGAAVAAAAAVGGASRPRT